MLDRNLATLIGGVFVWPMWHWSNTQSIADRLTTSVAAHA